MIPEHIFNHILSTILQLPSRPILCPFPMMKPSNSRSIQWTEKLYRFKTSWRIRIFSNLCHITNSCNNSDAQIPNCNHFSITWENGPTTWALLDPIQDHLICDGLPSDNLILETLSSHPTGTVLTVTKNASNQINSLVVERSFKGEWALLIGNCDSDFPPIPLHKGMRVVITQNRDKNRGFVKGQQASIVNAENQTVFLRLENGHILTPISSHRLL